jgi:hypothetical protein
LFKLLGPFHRFAATAHANAGEGIFASLPEILGATLGFALLCAAASALRNFIARKLIWPNSR